MASRFVKDMLMSQYRRGRDGRNPYGSRGGYVRSDRNMEDYARRGRRDYGEDYNMDYARGRRDYNDYDYGYDMARGGRRDRVMDYGYEEDYARGGRRDYGDDEKEYGKLSKKDYEEWGKHLKNSDGSHGEHFHKEHVDQIAKRAGINIDNLGGEDVFAMAMNMMYSDYAVVAKKYGVDRPEYYADLAKAFLHDKDYKGEPEEKLWLYYKCIAEDDED